MVENLFIVIFHLIFKIDPPCMIDQVKESLRDIVDQFVSPKGYTLGASIFKCPLILCHDM